MSFVGMAVGAGVSLIGTGVNAGMAAGAASDARKQFEQALMMGTQAINDTNKKITANMKPYMNTGLQNNQILQYALNPLLTQDFSMPTAPTAPTAPVRPNLKGLNGAQRAKANAAYRQDQREFKQAQAQYKKDLGAYNTQVANAPGRAMGGVLTQNYGWDNYLKENGLDPNTTQAGLLKGFTQDDMRNLTGDKNWSYGDQLKMPTAQDFGKAIGNSNFSLADLTNNGFNPSTFQSQTGVNYKDLFKEYDPDKFQLQTGYRLQDLSKEYNNNDFMRQFGVDLAQQMNSAPGMSGNGLKNLYSSPVYEFASQQGDRALQRSLAAGNGTLNGAAMKAALNFNQGLASQQYQNAFNNWATQTGINLNQFNTQQQNRLTNNQMGQNLYNQLYQNDLSNRTLGLNQYNQMFDQAQTNLNNLTNTYNTWYGNTVNNQNRNLGEYWNMANYKNTVGQNLINNYQNQFNNANTNKLNLYNMLSGQQAVGYGAANSLNNGLLTTNANHLNLLTGNASANAQNSWNQAMGVAQGMNGLMDTAGGLAGIYLDNSMKTKPAKIG